MWKYLVFTEVKSWEDQFKDEDIAEFTYSLNNGYKFKHWITEESGEPISTEKFYKHQMRGDLNLTAVVTERKYNVEISISPSASGYVLLNGDVISDSRIIENFTYGSDLNISAHPEESNYFVKWGVTGTNNIQETLIDQSFTLNNDIKIVAYFAPEGLLELKLGSKPEGAASYLFGGGSFEYDPNHSILTLAKKGYEFSHWDYNGTVASWIVRDPYSSSTSVNLDSDKELIAFFKSDSTSPPPSDDSNKLYLLSVYSNNITQGTANGSGFFRGTRTIKAFPKEGFIFSHWEGADMISNAYDEIAQVIV